MPAKGFQLTSIEAKRHRKSAPQKQVRIDHNTTILSVKKKSKKEMIVELRYTVSYGLLGIVQLDCEIIYVENHNTEAVVKKWEREHKLPDNIEVPIIPLPAPYVRPNAKSDSPGSVPDGNVNDG